jgi:hypothetical protein
MLNLLSRREGDFCKHTELRNTRTSSELELFHCTKTIIAARKRLKEAQLASFFFSQQPWSTFQKKKALFRIINEEAACFLAGLPNHHYLCGLVRVKRKPLKINYWTTTHMTHQPNRAFEGDMFYSRTIYSKLGQINLLPVSLEMINACQLSQFLTNKTGLQIYI